MILEVFANINDSMTLSPSGEAQLLLMLCSGERERCSPCGNCSTSAFGDSVPDLSCHLEILVKAEDSQWNCQQKDLAPKCLLKSPWLVSLALERALTGKVKSCMEMRRGRRDGSGRCSVRKSGYKSLELSSVFHFPATQRL